MNMANICSHCGTQNQQSATFCRCCGNQLINTLDSVTYTKKNVKPAWLLFCRGLSLIMIIYGLFALVTLHSEVYNKSYTGEGHYNYVITHHHDGIGLIKSVGYGYSMTEGTPLDSIVIDSMNNGKKDYYAACTVLIVIGVMVGGISSYIIHRKKNK